MNLSDDQRIAVAKVLVDIMLADGEMHTEELRHLKEMQRRLDISSEDMEDAMEIDNSEAYEALNGISDANKVELGHILATMLHADDDAHEAEDAKLKKICQGAGIPLQ